MAQKPKKSKTQRFYDRIADIHNLMMKVNGYQSSIAKLLRSLDLNLDKNSLILDAGSGTGIVTLGFYGAGFRAQKTFAVDLSLNLLKISREQFETDKQTDGNNICVVQGDVLKLPFADETFDLVLSCGVLEYISVEDGLKEFARVLKKDAKLVLIPVRPSLVGSILEKLYNFKTHSIEETKKIAESYFEISGVRKFPFTEPISWSKMVFLLQKK
ncbi:MAG: class I SAM-dependent methyltransferase [Acidobacteria bacterium]|nr:class I SAM-dependent methyltransferase [Acidobacteriota bacterium]MCA1640128.1 class I SAM-dependent methyltransferase [Acidobacteriota bacterium]